ncbi:ABC transporter permease [Chloroflexota bacterium]
MEIKENLRLIWAITAKDLLETLKNKNTIAVLLSTLFLVFMYRLMPVLERGDAPPNVLLYDKGESALVTALENDSAIKLYNYPSEKDMMHDLANGDFPELGLVIPPDFDQSLANGAELELQGFVLHWVSDSDAVEQKRFVEEEIYQILGAPVDINLDGGTVVTGPDATGVGLLTGLGMAFIIVMTGMVITPHLMLEEKQTRTIDVLMISPANSGHITIAKAFAALFYSLLTIGVSFAVNYTLIVSWPLAILVALCGSLFTVSMGLLLGTVIETRQQLMLWAWVMLIPLSIPMFLSIMDDLLPETLVTIFKWIPTTMMFRIFRVSFSDQISFKLYGPGLIWIILCAALVMFIIAWLIRRMDRK